MGIFLAKAVRSLESFKIGVEKIKISLPHEN